MTHNTTETPWNFVWEPVVSTVAEEGVCFMLCNLEIGHKQMSWTHILILFLVLFLDKVVTD